MLIQNLFTTVVLSLLAITAEAKESFTLLFNATESKCFPVRLQSSPGYLNLHLASYKSPSKDDLPDVAVLVARRDDINYKKKYYNDHGSSYKICTIEAVKDGYCTHKSLGKYLYELSDPFAVASSDLVYDDILWELGTYESVFKFKETGFYCIYSAATDVEGYELGVEIIDGFNLTNDQRIKLMISNFELMVTGVFLIAFSTFWNFWNSSNVSVEIPFVVKGILISTSVELLLHSLVKLDLQFFQGDFPLLSHLIDFNKNVYHLGLLLFLYHFTFSFSYSFDKALTKDKEGIFYFIIAFIVKGLNPLFPSVSFFKTSTIVIDSFIIIMIFVRYRIIAEEYSYNLALSPIRHSQFRSLILTTAFTEFILPALLLNTISLTAFKNHLFPQISPFIAHFLPSLSNPLIDSSYDKVYGDIELPIAVSLIRLLLRFSAIFRSWNPKLVNSGLKLDETLEKLTSGKYR